uniref:Uncharacterized protein LOC111106894 n=1 Tax=Crassostrea virginica TaxID=6565 RepID=A0A8B8B242_CRAVI|nr:uncharacterized protein LOC111106894 [Crassostrea virginica]
MLSSKRFREESATYSICVRRYSDSSSRSQSKVDADDGMIRLPNPRKMTAGWTTTYSFFPDTTRAEVQQYITDCSKSHGISVEGSKSWIESMYLSGHVTGVEYHQISPNLNYCFIRATVCRQMAVTQDPYSTWVILHKKTGVVQSGYIKS